MALTVLGLVAATTDLSGAGWVHGLKLAAVAVVAQAVWSMAGTLTPDWPRRAVALVAAAVGAGLDDAFSQVAIIAAGALVGRCLPRAGAGRHSRSEPSPVSRRVGAAAFTVFVALLVGLPVLRVADGQIVGHGRRLLPGRGARLRRRACRPAAARTRASVTPGWVSEGQFLAGYGAAQAVPGPLFTFAAYLGAVSGPEPNGVGGAALALGRDLPAVVPAHPRRAAVLGPAPGIAAGPPRADGTNAAVVGILLAALYTPVWTGAVTGPIDVAVAAVGLGLLLTGRVPPIAVVALSSGRGAAPGRADRLRRLVELAGSRKRLMSPCNRAGRARSRSPRTRRPPGPARRRGRASGVSVSGEST